MSRTILMGDPTYFSVRGGANPHTRNLLGLRKHVNPARARRQWHDFAQTLVDYGAEVLVLEPEPNLPGLVYPANAGVLYPLEGCAAERKLFYLSNLLPTRAQERPRYREFIRSAGFVTADVTARFEGEADFFPAGRMMLFTHGRIERQRFIPSLSLPPWRRIYGFRSEAQALAELRRIAADREILSLELCLEAHYHGDTVLCSFGPDRRYLLAYMDGLSPQSQSRLKSAFGADLIELNETDARLYAANSFQLQAADRLLLFMPQGISAGLLSRVRERGVEPVLMDVGEFLAKGGGSIKCMLLDLGPIAELPANEVAAAFLRRRSYTQLFPGGPEAA